MIKAVLEQPTETVSPTKALQTPIMHPPPLPVKTIGSPAAHDPDIRGIASQPMEPPQPSGQPEGGLASCSQVDTTAPTTKKEQLTQAET